MAPSTSRRRSNNTRASSSNSTPQGINASSSTSKNPLNFGSLGAQSFVTIYCKDTTEPYCVHKSVITHHSPFFAAAFNSDFKEGKAQSMTFEDVEAPIFGCFNNWLYTKKIINEHGNELQLIENAKLWSLAQRFLVPDLEAILLKDIEKASPSSDPKSGNTLKDFQHYVYVVADQQDDSGLKRLVMQKTLASVREGNIDEFMVSIPTAMLFDVTKVLLKGCTMLAGWDAGLGFEGVTKKANMPASDLSDDDEVELNRWYKGPAIQSVRFGR